jgi:hypothetical protein
MVFVGSAFFGLVAKDEAREKAEVQDRDGDTDNDEGGGGNVRKMWDGQMDSCASATLRRYFE